MDELTKRNFNALSEGLKQVRAEAREASERVKQLETAITQMQQQITAIQGQTAALIPLAYGTGATSTRV